MMRNRLDFDFDTITSVSIFSVSILRKLLNILIDIAMVLKKRDRDLISDLKRF